MIHQPAEPLHPIIFPWPFMTWGMDIVGPLPRAPGKRLWIMLAMTDYFTKWVEVETFREVKDKQVISFIKRNIICRFGIPSEIICDYGSQFASNDVEGYCAKWNISLKKSAPMTPKSNGQAESSNKIIMDNLKRRLEELGGKWADELPLVLCVEMIRSLDTIDELRASAKIHLAAYKQSVAKSYNKNVKIKILDVGDLVLREVFQNTRNHKAGKFAYKWEGPYQVEGVVGHGAYRLMAMDGHIIHKPWNILHLKRYHF
ncbi:uncharacterized protein LOC141631903 [Silene latifolia]|uniref:uncharacterized protein LOC141631903 n=1 Tax=Silene latifolia TaxID=37657 RepID=UPI003D784FFD